VEPRLLVLSGGVAASVSTANEPNGCYELQGHSKFSDADWLSKRHCVCHTNIFVAQFEYPIMSS
jgi:hypothetical protein